MYFTKQEMQDELARFMHLFGQDLSSLFGAPASALTDESLLKRSPLWTALSDMYDYGITGQPTGLLAPGSFLDAEHAQAEAFLRALDTVPMKIFLHGNPPPRLAMRAARCAVARLVLDGGDRQNDFGVDENGVGHGDTGYLTLAEVALLANMDERSVRNAANPKLVGHLKTEMVGRRSLVTVAEARRWLAGRRGFVPTTPNDNGSGHRPTSFDLELPPDVAAQLQRGFEEEAARSGITFRAYFEKKVLEAAKAAIAQDRSK